MHIGTFLHAWWPRSFNTASSAVVGIAEALDGILDSLRRDGDYMRRRAERQAEARQGWVEGLSFRPASIQQADRPPPSIGERVKESIDKACRIPLNPAGRIHVPSTVLLFVCGNFARRSLYRP